MAIGEVNHAVLTFINSLAPLKIKLKSKPNKLEHEIEIQIGEDESY